MYHFCHPNNYLARVLALDSNCIYRISCEVESISETFICGVDVYETQTLTRAESGINHNYAACVAQSPSLIHGLPVRLPCCLAVLEDWRTR